MTHDELVAVGARWLRKRKHPVVLCDVHTSVTDELPDVIAWTNGGHSTVVECKTSRADFLRDEKKQFRSAAAAGMGRERFFFLSSAFVAVEELPDGWGLLLPSARGGVVVSAKSRVFASYDAKGERALLVSAVRRVTEGWGRRIFGEIAPPLVDGDPHPSASRRIRDLRAENQKLKASLRAALKNAGSPAR